jgi:predicted nuclease of predicted toxin-antitoxin system
MIIWLDAQLPPQLAAWIKTEFATEAVAVRDLGLREANDRAIFEAAREANAILVSKDSDFVELVLRNGPPPKLIWLTCGNLSNSGLQAVLKNKLRDAISLLDCGDSIVEIG